MRHRLLHLVLVHLSPLIFLLCLFLFCIKKPERVFPYWNFVIKIFSPSCVGFFLGIVSLQHAGDTLVMWDSRCVYR